MLAFNYSSFHHFVQELNEICYPRQVFIKRLRYQISLTSYKKWQNGKYRHLIKIILHESVPFTVGHIKCIEWNINSMFSSLGVTSSNLQAIHTNKLF